jgi:hypothetical protein
MQFKEALKKAGLANPGRTTWCGVATDGIPVFTIWSNQIHQIGGRWFAWWDHNESRWPKGRKDEPARGVARARTFMRLAQGHLGKDCRAVILHPKDGGGVHSAEYPNQQFARARFRTADLDALQFIVELLPPVETE